MKHVIRLRAEAESDLRAALAWYEREREGLGEELLADLNSTFAAMAESPTSFPMVLPPFRRALLARFPYAVYFRESDESALFFAVFHARRDPGDLQRKLAK